MRGRDYILDRIAIFDDGCWVWTMSSFKNGYGVANCEGSTLYAHRVSYQAFVGPIPTGLELDHLCRKRICVNPHHLEPVTRRVNTLRGNGPIILGALNGSKTRCKRGHQYEGDNVYFRPTGGRACRTCNRIYKGRSADQAPLRVAD